jgi:hypothetical protein
MAAQHGVFLCDLGNEGTFDLTLLKMIANSVTSSVGSDDKHDGTFDVKSLHVFDMDAPVCKIVIKTTERIRFVTELDRMNIHGASLFPGLDGFARSIRLQLENRVDETYGLFGWNLVHRPAR